MFLSLSQTAKYIIIVFSCLCIGPIHLLYKLYIFPYVFLYAANIINSVFLKLKEEVYHLAVLKAPANNRSYTARIRHEGNSQQKRKLYYELYSFPHSLAFACESIAILAWLWKKVFQSKIKKGKVLFHSRQLELSNKSIIYFS